MVEIERRTNTKFNLDSFREASKDSAGILSLIASRLGVSRRSIYEWTVKKPEVQKIIQEEREKMLDVAENQLFKNVTAGEEWAIKYFLSTRGRERGYIIKQEVEHKTAQPLQIIFEDVIDVKSNTPENDKTEASVDLPDRPNNH